ncbi:speckle-type POZ protein-like A [Nasonia vitripennis]|uniref:BTB domain-containing protein n=1 Tax=Nasonia vitripennis TaxID=7425 RepID=A0A7M7Q775_NASVI|nr:speckle-type POZ protein-like A [Nasonia vitripennis]
MSNDVHGTINVVQKPESVYLTWIFKKFWQTKYASSPARLLECMTSPDIKSKINGNEHTWYFQIHVSDVSTINDMTLVDFTPVKARGILRLRLKTDLDADVDVKVECSLIGEKGRVLNSKITECTFTKSVRTVDISDIPYCYNQFEMPPVFRESGDAEENVGVVCEITYRRKAAEAKKSDTTSLDVSSLSNDLKLLFETEKFSDLTIVVEQQEFHVHKAILASRSPVFLAMLENDMAEKQNNRVDIADVDYETMHHVLLYAYTGKVEKLELAGKLLGPADKYALDTLKNTCAEALANDLTVENVVKTLVLANLYRVGELKKKALEFMGRHFHEVTQTAGFESLLKPNSDLFKTF